MPIDPRTSKSIVAQQTLDIISSGSFDKLGKRIYFKDDISSSADNTILYAPTMARNIELALQNELSGRIGSRNTTVEITSESILSAAKRLVQEGYEKTCCLSASSPLSPGGNFTKGSIGQEEDIFRATTLYASVSQQKDFFEINGKSNTLLYTDAIIYSPNVTVFRDEADNLISAIFNISVISACPVNMGKLRETEKSRVDSATKVMEKRIEKILSVAAINKCSALVISDFGCRIFRNSPEDISLIFANTLSGKFKNVFRKIVFAIDEKSPLKPSATAFKKNLSSLATSL